MLQIAPLPFQIEQKAILRWHQTLKWPSNELPDGALPTHTQARLRLQRLLHCQHLYLLLFLRHLDMK